MKYFRFDGVKIKSPSKIEAMKKAGRLSAEALEAVASVIAPGVSTAQLDACAEEVIRMGGGTPAFKGYGGFPASVCTSINEVVVHGIPSKRALLREGDIVSIDTGAIVDGWVGDNAATFPVGDINSLKQRLIDVTRAALDAGVAQARPGNHLGDVGHAIQSVIEEAGFSVVRDYSGHGVGRRMHEPPMVLNYGMPGQGMLLEKGMVIAIEPMACAGSADVRVLSNGWSVATCDGMPAAHFERTVAVLEDGPLTLTSWNLQKNI